MSLIRWFFPVLALTSTLNLSAFQQDFTGVAKQAIPAVVSIKTKVKTSSHEADIQDFFGHSDLFRHFFQEPQRRMPQVGQASGFIVSEDGYILTNCHVVKDADEVTVTLTDGREFDATVIGTDQNTDIALVKVTGEHLPHLKFADSDDLQVGQWVVAIGNPLGLQASLTVGVVSAKGRNNLDITRVEDFIQTDAAINRGNSGGPLLNLNGEVVGMNTAIVSNGGAGGHMGIGFAIPSAMLGHIVDQLRLSGTVARGYLGIYLQPIDKDLAQAFGLDKPQGALVGDMSSNSPAAEAGIKKGDILLKFNDAPIQNAGSLRNRIAMMAPGAHGRFTVLREQSVLELPITIGNHPDEVLSACSHEKELGLHVEKSPNEGQGVIVSGVDPNSLAGWAGIRKGTVILEVNKTAVNSVETFAKEVAKTPKEKPLLLLVKNGEFTQFLSLRLK